MRAKVGLLEGRLKSRQSFEQSMTKPLTDSLSLLEEKVCTGVYLVNANKILTPHLKCTTTNLQFKIEIEHFIPSS
jgi:hypothetical protein